MATARLNPGRFRGLDRMQREMAQEIAATMSEIGDKILQDVQTNLSGRVLNVRTGRLRANVSRSVTADKNEVKLSIGTDLSIVPYARIHELGGWTGAGHRTKIPKRPYLRRALVENKDFIRRRLDKTIGKLTRLH